MPGNPFARVQTASPKNVSSPGTTVVKTEFQSSHDRKFFLDSRLTLAMAVSLLISFGALACSVGVFGRSGNRDVNRKMS